MSTLHRNSEPRGPALVSTRDTSPRTMRGIGHHDKVPVYNQNVPEAERCVYSLDAVLPWPWEHLCSTHQEPDNNSGGRVATVSLRRGQPCQWRCHFSTECLLTSIHSIAQRFKTVKSRKEGKDGVLCMWQFLPGINSRGFLATITVNLLSPNGTGPRNASETVCRLCFY